MKYFKEVETLEDLKKQYRKLAFKHHPDVGGSVEEMQEINNEHDKLFNQLKDEKTTETPEQFRDILNKIIHIEDIEIELIGTWLWVKSEKHNKEVLKDAGFIWHSKKSLWYWTSTEKKKRWGNGKKSIEELRNDYGSQKIKNKKNREKIY